MGGCEPIYFQVLPSYILMMSPKPMLPPTMFREDTDVATNVDYDVDFSSGCVLMLPKSPPTHPPCLHDTLFKRSYTAH